MENSKWNIANVRLLAVLMGLLTLCWSCSSDDDDNGGSESDNQSLSGAYTFTATEGFPDWQVDWVGNEEAPKWESPAANLFEERMYVIIKLSNDYIDYSTNEDRMAVFVGDECRGVSKRNLSDFDMTEIYFTILVAGNKYDSENMASLTLKYYSGGMHQTFTFPGFHNFAPDDIVGDTWDQSLPLSPSGSKYQDFKLMSIQLKDAPFSVAPSDNFAVFIDGECRGVGYGYNQFEDDIYIWLKSEEEEGKKMQLRYYSVEKQGYYTWEETIEITQANRFEETLEF